eukprot:COSAG02_NODE_3388_length_6828_cov_19.910685_4_plen_54_part_00
MLCVVSQCCSVNVVVGATRHSYSITTKDDAAVDALPSITVTDTAHTSVVVGHI